MAYTLDSAYLQLVIHPEKASWSLYSRQRKGPFLEKARCRVEGRRGWRRFRSLETWKPFSAWRKPRASISHGPTQQATLTVGPDPQGLQYRLIFSLPKDHPLLLWKMTVENLGHQAVRLDQLVLLKVGAPRRTKALFRGSEYISVRASGLIEYQGLIRPYPDPGELAFFSNGWQSWSFSGSYRQSDRLRRTRLGLLRETVVNNPWTPRPIRRGHFTSEMFAVLGDRTHRTGILAGFLSQREHFGSIEAWTDPFHPSLNIWANGDGALLDTGQKISTDWACLQFLHLDEPDPMGPYLDAVARENVLRAEKPVPTGWCSWYHLYEKVGADDIRRNLQTAAERNPEWPLDVIQIDDGYETQIGDWDSFRPTFPGGMAPLAEEIQAAGKTPGLWLAPFIVHPRSQLARAHPGWILRNRLGVPANAGFNWNAINAALDLTHPEVLAHTQELVHTAVHRWGYPYLKLDFLYAAALPGRRKDPTKTRAQTLRLGLKAIRQAAGEEATLLGCGCPLGPAIGLVDAMRISPDVAERWDPAYKGVTFFFNKEDSIPAGVNAAHNSIVRSSLHRRWWINDPDCLLLRTGTRLTTPEVQTLATVVALTGGSVLVSDNLAALPLERFQILESLLPVISKRPHVLDWFEGGTPSRLQLDLTGPIGIWHVIALFNWDRRPQTLPFNLNDFFLETETSYLARDFWSGAVWQIQNGSITLGPVPPHGVVCLALRQEKPHWPRYLGGNLHISQGLEVTTWEPSKGGLTLVLARPGRASGEIDLRLPYPLQHAALNGEPIPWKIVGDNQYRIAVEFIQTGELKLTGGTK